MLDRAGRVLASNQNAERLLELPVGTLEDCLAYPVLWSVVDEAGRELSPEDYPSTVCMRTGQAEKDVVVGVAVTGEVRRWLAVNSVPIAVPGQTHRRPWWCRSPT